MIIEIIVLKGNPTSFAAEPVMNGGFVVVQVGQRGKGEITLGTHFRRVVMHGVCH